MAKLRDTRGRFVGGNGHNLSPSGGYGDLILYNQISELVNNATFSRAQLAEEGSLLDIVRSINHECHYPGTENITVEMYREMYDREAIAARVVEILPRESWQVSPTVCETEDADNVTTFEEAWEELPRVLKGSSWYKGEEGNPVWEYLRRGDELSGIGRFGVLLLGLDDGAELSEPTEGLDEEGQASGGPVSRKLLYLRAFDESAVSIKSYQEDRANPRYGQPTEYSIRLGLPSDSGNWQGVHWTRAIHLADNLGSNEVFGPPRMRPVWNRLLDVRKLYGGDAEAYWRNVVMKLFFETHPQLGGDVDVDASDMKDAMEQMLNGLQQWALLRGMSAKPVAPAMADPTPHVEAQIVAICIKMGIPKRVFMGSERGELASSQDAKAWNGRLRFRQANYITPRIIVPFIDRLIAVRVLPVPEEYTVVWPDLDALTDQEQAEIAVRRTEAFAKYVQGGVHSLMPPLDYLTRVHGMEQAEAEAVLEAAVEEVEAERKAMEEQWAKEAAAQPQDGNQPGGREWPADGKSPPK